MLDERRDQARNAQSCGAVVTEAERHLMILGLAKIAAEDALRAQRKRR
jgi:hypothetical protein